MPIPVSRTKKADIVPNLESPEVDGPTLGRVLGRIIHEVQQDLTNRLGIAIHLQTLFDGFNGDTNLLLLGLGLESIGGLNEKLIDFVRQEGELTRLHFDLGQRHEIGCKLRQAFGSSDG